MCDAAFSFSDCVHNTCVCSYVHTSYFVNEPRMFMRVWGI